MNSFTINVKSFKFKYLADVFIQSDLQKAYFVFVLRITTDRDLNVFWET